MFMATVLPREPKVNSKIRARHDQRASPVDSNLHHWQLPAQALTQLTLAAPEARSSQRPSPCTLSVMSGTQRGRWTKGRTLDVSPHHRLAPMPRLRHYITRLHARARRLRENPAQQRMP